MNSLWTSAEICAATGGECGGAWHVSGVEIDSRAVKHGDLFVALAGENIDGHRFVGQAIDSGAAGVLASQLSDAIPAERQIVVPNVEAALNALARHRRSEVAATIIAVTGSVGKTSVKEMLAHVLAQCHPEAAPKGLQQAVLDPSTSLRMTAGVHATAGNFNNHLGLPITLARMPRDATIAVLELGMNHAGEIAELSTLARPNIGIITNVEAVHTEFFDNGTDGIADAKSELWHGLEHGGSAILPHDSPHYPRLLASAKKGGLKQLVSFGTHPESDIILRACVPDVVGQKLSIEVRGEAHSYTLGLRGEHQALNSCAVIAALLAAKIPLVDALPHFASVQPQKGRGRIHLIDINGTSVRLIDDSYNASPASMRAALQLLAERATHHGSRSVAILGDMLELGDDSASYHAELLKIISQNNINHVFTCGKLMQNLHSILPKNITLGHADSPETLAPMVESALQQDDILLVKGSHGSNMWQLVARWLE